MQFPPSSFIRLFFKNTFYKLLCLLDTYYIIFPIKTPPKSVIPHLFNTKSLIWFKLLLINALYITLIPSSPNIFDEKLIICKLVIKKVNFY
jgi:hypothetical protein